MMTNETSVPVRQTPQNPEIERKASTEYVEDADAELGKKPGDIGGLEVLEHEIIHVSQEDNDRLRKLFDKRILPILTWVYFLQILDKFVFGYGNIYGMSTDLGLVGTQYSLASTMNNIAQLAWMPFSAYLIVRVPANILMPVLVFGWGASATAMGGSQNLAALSAFRFLLGLFEAGCLPLFSVITAHYYRRSEQPVRVAIWYATNGLGQIVSSLLSYAFGTIPNPSIESWRILFIFVGLLTVLTAPVVWWMLPPDIQRCKFLTEEDKAKAIERVRANQTGTGSNVFKWDHVWEALYDPKTYLLGSLAICINFGATVTTAFGPTLIRDIGFTKEQAALLNSPFGALQSVTICAGAYLAQRFKMKGIILGIMTLPVLAGVAMLYVANSAEERDRTTALAGYYMMAFLFAGNPLIVSWMVANTGGQTKKSVILSFYNAFNATGSIIGPLQFSASDAPRYLPGLRKALGVFSAFIGINIICFGLLWVLNKQRERQRVAAGKPAKIRDTSMLSQYETYGREGGLGENAMKDMTDWRNNEFTYVY